MKRIRPGAQKGVELRPKTSNTHIQLHRYIMSMAATQLLLFLSCGACRRPDFSVYSEITPLSGPEKQLLVPYSTKANAFCDLGRKKIGKNEPCSLQKALAFVEYGTGSCLSGSDRVVVLLYFTAVLNYLVFYFYNIYLIFIKKHSAK